MGEEAKFDLKKFNVANVKSNSIITILGKETNVKILFKEYGKYFDNMGQFTSIMDGLKTNESLVIDETCPKDKLEHMLYVLKN
jgi:hypothetical protein